MNTIAYSEFATVPTDKLLSAFKNEYSKIPKEQHTKSLELGLEALAKQTAFDNLQAMMSQQAVLIRTSEFIAALESCGLELTPTSTAAHYGNILGCDVLCMESQGSLCVGIRNGQSVVQTPYRDAPAPYSPDVEFYSLPSKQDGTWLESDAWQQFVKDLENKLDFEDELEEQILGLWQDIDASECGELFVSSHPDTVELAECSEARFRQVVIEKSGHTPVELLYNYFSDDRD